MQAHKIMVQSFFQDTHTEIIRAGARTAAANRVLRLQMLRAEEVDKATIRFVTNNRNSHAKRFELLKAQRKGDLYSKLYPESGIAQRPREPRSAPRPPRP